MNIKPSRPSIAVAVVGVALLVCPWVAHAESPEDVLVITNNAFSQASLSHDEVQQLFLKKRTEVGGQAVTVFVAPSKSPLRDAFARLALRMDPTAEGEYWYKQQIVSGLSEPAASASALKTVFTLPSSISYIFRKDLKPDAVKVVATFPQ